MGEGGQDNHHASRSVVSKLAWEIRITGIDTHFKIGPFPVPKPRNHVRFIHPAEQIFVSEDEGICSVEGAGWLAEIVQRIPELSVNSELLQEDWGAMVFAERHGARFWLGLNFGPNGDDDRLAHAHHDCFLWPQWLTKKGIFEYRRLLEDVHNVLVADPNVSQVSWYFESDVWDKSFATPLGN